MAVKPAEEVPFEAADPASVAACLAELEAAGAGWVNLLPEVEPGEELPPRNLVVAIFSARGDAVPMATWHAPAQPGGRATLGIEHGTGPKALERLAAAGLGLPPGWLKVSDHPRRGLVVTTPGGTSPERALGWLLAAAEALSVPPLTGSWLARVYRP